MGNCIQIYYFLSLSLSRQADVFLNKMMESLLAGLYMCFSAPPRCRLYRHGYCPGKMVALDIAKSLLFCPVVDPEAGADNAAPSGQEQHCGDPERSEFPAP